MAIRQKLKQQALSFSQRALEKVLADEGRAMRIAQAVGSVQRGKKALEHGQDQLLRTFNFAARGDFKELGKKLSSLKRRVRELEEKIEQASHRKAREH